MDAEKQGVALIPGPDDNVPVLEPQVPGSCHLFKRGRRGCRDGFKGLWLFRKARSLPERDVGRVGLVSLGRHYVRTEGSDGQVALVVVKKEKR